jgi:transcription termination factor Rho
MAILIGERPEEVTEMKRFIKGEVAASNFDESPRQQVKVANLGLERAKRLVEMGHDVIILLDSITRLARAFNLSVSGTGRSLSGGFDPSALFPAKKFLGAARNCEEGGSLTIIGTALVGTESRMDDLIYEEFKGTGNMEVHLDRRFADKRIFPAIDVEKSGTRHEELLFDKDNYQKHMTLRRMLAMLSSEERLAVMIEKLQKVKTNQEFLDSLSGQKT